VFFDSPDALVPQDTNGRYDVYEYDVAAGEVRLISSGKSSSDSYFDEATPDGSDVFFTTREPLVAEDTDTVGDLYDARVDGGIAAQVQLPSPGCAGDACQGAAGVAPGFGAPSSQLYVGAGNLPAAPPPVAVKHKPKKLKPHRKKRPRKQRRHGRTRARGAGESVSHRVGR
jgi:hypothetical protein